MSRFRTSRALVVVLAIGSNLACADILGIDAPAGRGDSAAAGIAGAVSKAGSAGTGGAAGEGGRDEAGEGGGAEAGEGGRDEAGRGGYGGNSSTLYIEGPELTTVCPGTLAPLQLTAKGGTPPYRWKIVGADLGFKLLAPDPSDNHVTLSGALATAGSYTLQVQVTDAAGAAPFSRGFLVVVQSGPVITLSSIPSVCPNELYSVELTAEGGDPTSYRWTVDLPQATGIAVKDNYLTGKFLGGIGDATHADFTLRVADSGTCPAQPVALSLAFEQPTATVCPEVRVEGQRNGNPPPAPCLGNDYDEKLGMLRGKGAFQWFVDSAPPGLSFDPLSQEITGVSTGPGTLVTRATDSVTKRTIVTSFALQPRDKCWLAYLAKEANTQRLHFFDALLSDASGAQGRTKTLASEPVSDFRFSPDGKYLAYRKGNAGSALSLSVVNLATWQEGPIDRTNVTEYEWSPDSSALAVAIGATPNQVLGWVNVAHPLPGSSSTLLVFPSVLTVPAAVASDLVWFDKTHLAFLSAFAPTVLSPNTVVAGSNGFGTPGTYPAFYFAGDTLRPAAHGVFVISSFLGIFYYGSDGSNGVPHGNDIISPSGNYLGRGERNSLLLFRATEPSTGDAKAHATQLGCDSVLAWASGTERIACAHQTGAAQDELTFFDVDPNSDALSSARSLPLLGSSSTLLGRRRLFSPGGGLFAYSTDTTLSIANLAGATLSAKQVSLDPNATNTFAEFAFAPNGQRLLQHRGSQLSFFDLLTPDLDEVRFDDPVLPPSVSCVEGFNDLGTGFCGVERPATTLLWSPGSDLAAFQSATGSLEIEDFTSQKQGYFEQVHVNPSCNQSCVVSGQFGFQP